MAETATAPAPVSDKERGKKPQIPAKKPTWVKKPSQWRVYKPKKTNDGAASRVEMKVVQGEWGDRDVQLFWVASPQTGVDSRGNAAFAWADKDKDTRSVTMKLGEVDIGELLSVLNRRKDAVGGKSGIYHENANSNTSMTFSYNAEYKLYNVRIARQDKATKKLTEVKHSISLGEAEILRVLLEAAVLTSYDW